MTIDPLHLLCHPCNYYPILTRIDQDTEWGVFRTRSQFSATEWKIRQLVQLSLLICTDNLQCLSNHKTMSGGYTALTFGIR